MADLIKSYYLFYLITIFIMPFSLLIRILYSQTISITDFGLIFSIVNFFGIIMIFTNLGLSNSLKYFIPKFLAKNNIDKVRNIFYYTFSIQLSLVLIVSLIIFFLSSFLAKNYFDSGTSIIIIKIFLIYFIFFVLFNSLSDLFVAHELFIYNRVIKLIQISLIFFFSLSFFLLEINNLIFFYSLSWGLSSLIVFLIYLIIYLKKFRYIFKKKPSFDFILLKEQIKYSFFTMISGFGTNILNQIDVVMITYFLSVSSVAFYSNAFALSDAIIGFFAMLSLVFMPKFSELKEKNQYHQLRNILSTLYEIILFFILPITLILFTFSEIIIITIFGEKYLSSGLLLSIFAVFMIFKILFKYNIAFMNGLGLAKNLSIILISTSIFNIIFNLTLINIYQEIGVVFATTISWLLLFIITYISVSKETNYKINYFKIIKILFSGIIFLGLTILLKKNIFLFNIYFTGIIIIIISYISYFIFGYLIKIFTIKDLYIFIPQGKLKKKLKFYHKKYFSFLK